MKFCCTTDDLFCYYETCKSKPIQTNDYITLTKDKSFVQLEFDFDSLAKNFEEKKKIEEKKTSRKDKNMELMVKYKYDTISEDELNELYENLEKVVYKIVRHNYVSENFEDVCNEVWRRIAKYKHKFDETKNICVTTWVGKVTINVINTIRRKSIVYKSRNVSYDGMMVYNKKGEAQEIDPDKIFAEEKDDTGEYRKTIYENIMSCFEDCNDIEKQIINLYLNEDDENLMLQNEKRTYKRWHVSATFIKKKLNLTQNQYVKHMKSIGKKYVAKQKQNPNDGIDYGILHRIL